MTVSIYVSKIDLASMYLLLQSKDTGWVKLIKKTGLYTIHKKKREKNIYISKPKMINKMAIRMYTIMLNVNGLNTATQDLKGPKGYKSK